MGLAVRRVEEAEGVVEEGAEEEEGLLGPVEEVEGEEEEGLLGR